METIICQPSTAAITAVAVTLILSLYFGFGRKGLLRDKNFISPSDPSYSLSRTILFCWTVIIACCYVYFFFNNYEFGHLNGTAAALLGIGTATLLGSQTAEADTEAKVERNRAKGVEIPETQKTNASSASLFGLLSDNEQVVALHRFQALLFNALFMGMFLVSFSRNCVFPNFDTSELALLAIGDAGYVFYKFKQQPN